MKFDQNLCLKELVIRPKEVTLVTRTQPSGPLCSGEREDFLAHRPSFFFYENDRNSETRSQKIVPKVGNELSLRRLQTGL